MATDPANAISLAWMNNIRNLWEWTGDSITTTAVQALGQSVTNLGTPVNFPQVRLSGRSEEALRDLQRKLNEDDRTGGVLPEWEGVSGRPTVQETKKTKSHLVGEGVRITLVTNDKERVPVSSLVTSKFERPLTFDLGDRMTTVLGGLSQQPFYRDVFMRVAGVHAIMASIGIKDTDGSVTTTMAQFTGDDASVSALQTIDFKLPNPNASIGDLHPLIAVLAASRFCDRMQRDIRKCDRWIEMNLSGPLSFGSLASSQSVFWNLVADCREYIDVMMLIKLASVRDPKDEKDPGAVARAHAQAGYLVASICYWLQHTGCSSLVLSRMNQLYYTHIESFAQRMLGFTEVDMAAAVRLFLRGAGWVDVSDDLGADLDQALNSIYTPLLSMIVAARPDLCVRCGYKRTDPATERAVLRSVLENSGVDGPWTHLQLARAHLFMLAGSDETLVSFRSVTS